MKPRIGLMAVICALALLVSACGSSKSSSGTHANSPFRVLLETDLTGPTKLYGGQYVIALHGAVAYINSHGGILGHPIALTTLDDNGNGSTAVSVMLQYLTSHPKPNAAFVGSTDIDTTSLIPIVKRERLLAFGAGDGPSACARNAQTTCPTYFSIIPPQAIGTTAAADWFKQHGYRKVGILEEQQPLAETETPPLVSDLTADGVKTVTAQFPATAVTVTPEVSEIKSAGADVLWAETLGPPAGYVAAARKSLGLISTDPLVYDPGGASVDLTTLAPKSDLTNAYEEIQRPGDPSLDIQGRTLLLQYSKKYGALTQPLSIASFPWDSFTTLQLAAKQANSISQTALINALNNLSPSAQTSPLHMLESTLRWTPNVHEDVAAAASDYVFVPVGPLLNGQVQSR